MNDVASPVPVARDLGPSSSPAVVQPIIDIRGLRKSFGDGDRRREVVCGVDLAIARGECFALLGPNGAGKTTTLRLCLGLTAPDAGTILLGGLPVPVRGREARIRVGVVPQMDNLDPDFTVRREPARLRPLLRAARRDDPRAHPGPARVREPRREARREDLGAVGRHEATPDARPLARQRSRRRVHGRADDRPRPAGAAPDLGPVEDAACRRQDDPADDALHGRGRAARRSPRGHGRRREDRRRHAARPDRRAPSSRASSRSTATVRRRGASTTASGAPRASRSAARRCSATRTTRTRCSNTSRRSRRCATSTGPRISRTCS